VYPGSALKKIWRNNQTFKPFWLHLVCYFIYVSLCLPDTHHLAGQRPANPPQHGQPPPPGAQMGGYQLPPGMPAGIPGFPLPQPISSGSLDLSSIKPVNTGSVSINDALAKARSFAAEKGIQYDPNRSNSGKYVLNHVHDFPN
jgi:hypothetical protein